MTSPKFTPRRMIWANALTGDQYIVNAENPGEVISTYPNSRVATDRNRADAALDLAAPEMYQALEFCLEWLIDQDLCSGACVYEEDGKQCLQCIVRSALASARGEDLP